MINLFETNQDDIDFMFDNLGKTLKWQINYVIYETLTIISNKSGFTTTDQYMTLPKGEFRLIMPHNSTTSTIERDQRFLFNNSAYKTTFVNRMNDTLLEVFVSEDQINKTTDNLELMIADYQTITYTLEVSPLTISVDAEATSQINAVLYKNGSVVENPSISYISSNESICTVNSNGLITGVTEGSTIITVSSEGETQTVNVDVAAVPSDNFTGTITGASSMKIGQTESYTVEWFNNGSTITDSIDTITVSDESLATLNKTGTNSFDVIANSDMVLGEVVVTVTSVTNAIETSKTITIESLW